VVERGEDVGVMICGGRDEYYGHSLTQTTTSSLPFTPPTSKVTTSHLLHPDYFPQSHTFTVPAMSGSFMRG